MPRNPDPELCMPYPEIVESAACDNPYTIIDSRDVQGLPSDGMTDKVNRHLIVPLNPSGRHVSLHELAHVKWSPLKLPPVDHDPRVLLAVEDGRINSGLAAAGMPMILPCGDLGRVTSLAAGDLASGQVAMFVMRAIASLGTNAEAAVLGPAEEHSHDIAVYVSGLVDRVREALADGRRRRSRPVTTFAHVRRIAAHLARELEAHGLLKPGRPVDERVVGPLCCLGGGVAPEEAAKARKLAIRLGSPVDASSVEPGRMNIVTAPLDVACPAVRCGSRRAWRPATEGSVIRWVHRSVIDGAIFRRPARRPGGTVLIDTSGSMSLTVEGVERILEASASAALVAMYSGSGTEGELRIIAQSGRRATGEHLKSFGTGNVVDLPALRWLARQAQPRIWISDGRVSGRGDHSSAALTRRCRRFRRQARIARVTTVEEAAKLLAGRRSAAT